MLFVRNFMPLLLLCIVLIWQVRNKKNDPTEIASFKLNWWYKVHINNINIVYKYTIVYNGATAELTPIDNNYFEAHKSIIHNYVHYQID